MENFYLQNSSDIERHIEACEEQISIAHNYLLEVLGFSDELRQSNIEFASSLGAGEDFISAASELIIFNGNVSAVTEGIKQIQEQLEDSVKSAEECLNRQYKYSENTKIDRQQEINILRLAHCCDKSRKFLNSLPHIIDTLGVVSLHATKLGNAFTVAANDRAHSGVQQSYPTFTEPYMQLARSLTRLYEHFIYC